MSARRQLACGLAAIASVLFTDVALAEVIGGCKFDTNSLTFQGSIETQTRCLLKKIKPKGAGAVSQEMPQWLLEHVGRAIDISAEQVDSYLRKNSIDQGDLGGPVRAGDAPKLRFFVIHDTSAPELEGDKFPSNINDASFFGNKLSGWPDTAKRVNLITSRDGRSRSFRSWGDSRPLPATKIEETRRVPRARPYFAHVENIQPRLKTPGSFFWKAPEPGLSPAQEQRLALAYVLASVHAGHWLIPAYHYNIDQGLPQGHDDPQNTDLPRLINRISEIVEATRS